jgi:lysophospholipase L1-like esterase
MMTLMRTLVTLLLLAPFTCAHADTPKPEKVRILLLGDSTVVGSVCRNLAPKADHLEDVVRKLLAAEKDLPLTEVINQGRDGEFIRGLLAGRYAKDIAKLGRIDVVVVRYGLNDLGQSKDFAMTFPKEYRELIARLRADYPKALILIETTIPYLGEAKDQQINDRVREVAKSEKVDLIDTHARYAAELLKQGKNSLNYRRATVKAVPERLHALLPESAHKSGYLMILDNSLDAHLADLPGWFNDRHPNLAGYHVIGDELAKALAPRLRERVSAAKKSER